MFDWVLHTPLRHLTVMAVFDTCLCYASKILFEISQTCKILDLYYFAVQVLDGNKWVKKNNKLHDQYTIQLHCERLIQKWRQFSFSIVVSVFYLHSILFQSASLPWFTLILLTADNNLRKSKILLIRIKNKRKKTRYHRVGGITKINSFLGG